MSSGPNQNRATIVIDDALAKRVRAFVGRVGYRRAQLLLGVGALTLDSAREQGRMKPATRDKLVAAMDEHEKALEPAGAA